MNRGLVPNRRDEVARSTLITDSNNICMQYKIIRFSRNLNQTLQYIECFLWVLVMVSESSANDSMDIVECRTRMTSYHSNFFSCDKYVLFDENTKGPMTGI